MFAGQVGEQHDPVGGPRGPGSLTIFSDGSANVGSLAVPERRRRRAGLDNRQRDPRTDRPRISRPMTAGAFIVFLAVSGFLALIAVSLVSDLDW